VPGPGITVQLPAAALLGRPELQALLSKQPRVLTAQQGEQRTLLVSWEPEELAAAVPFLTLLETIAGREAWYNGGRRPWNELFGFLPCYQRRQTTAQPERYCFWGQDGILNVFGCIKSRMPWSVAADWCRLGRFESPTSFLFDRERIGQELAARLYPFRFCPALDQAYLREAQRQFPERAVVVPEGPWSYQEADADSPGGLEVALPAGPGDPAPRVVRVDGVQPSDPELGLELVRLALLECGRDRTGIA